MNKTVQLNINRWCEDNFTCAMKEYEAHVSYYNYKQLRSCQAYVYETENYYILRSYKTFVAVIRKDNKQCYDVLRMVFGYTSTSNQHICKFMTDYGNRMLRYTYR